MKRSKIWYLIISIIIVIIIQKAMKGIIHYPPGGIIYFSFAYFACIYFTITAIGEVIHNKNKKICLITAATGINMTVAIITFMLSLFSTLTGIYKDIAVIVFSVSFIGFTIFDMMLIKEEQKKLDK